MSGVKPGELSKKYGIEYSTLTGRISKEGWRRELAKTGKKLAKKITKKIADETSVDVIELMRTRAEEYAGMHRAISAMAFETDDAGAIVGMRMRKMFIRVKGEGPRELTLPPAPDDMAKIMVALDKCHDLQMRALGYNDGAAVNAVWDREKTALIAELEKAGDGYAAVLPTIQKIAAYARDPRAAAGVIADARYKADSLEFTKQQALSQRQFDRLTEGFAGMLTRILAGDPDRMEEAARELERLLDRVVLGEKA